MNDLRKTTGPVRQALKAAVRRALTLAGGGDSVQYATRVKAPALSRYASSQEEYQENHCPVDVALDLDLEAGQPVILSAMAKAQGFDLVPTADAHVSSISWQSKLCTLGAIRGEFYAHMGAALADNMIDAEEAGVADAKIEEEIAQLRRIQARLRAEGGQGGNVVPVRMTVGDRNG